MLRAAYMGTLIFAGIKALETKKRVKVYITQVGGGAFGNTDQWIIDAVQNAVLNLKFLPIDVTNVFYGTQSHGWRELQESLQSVIKSGPENQK